ncbi:MAG: helix-turn-helix domain-containing protein, partial [Actinomycetota bacterium]
DRADSGSRRAEAELRRDAVTYSKRGAQGRLEGVLGARARAEEELSDAAGRREAAVAARYRLQSGVERLELRMESASALVERFGAVVGRETLARRAWPEQRPTRNALDVHMSRLRRRIAPLGLGVRTVRARGYLLQAVADSNVEQGDGARWPT